MSSRDGQNIFSYPEPFPTTCGLRILARYPRLLFSRHACKAAAAVYGSRNALGILAFLQFPYHGEPRAALNQCDHGPLVACSDDQVHLPIPMPCSVCLRRSLVYAGAAFDGHVLSSRALAVLQPKSVIRIWDKYKYVKKIHFYSIFLAKTLGFSMIIRIFAATELVCIPSELQASHFL